MNTKIEEIDDKIVVTLEGEMDTMGATEAETVLQPLFKCGSKDIVFECRKLEYIASSGLRIMIQILKNAKANGCSVVIRHVNDDIMNVFSMTGLNKSFTIE
jgi:anti-anti-sigma factor